MKFESAVLIQTLITFLFGCLTAYVASRRNRNPTIWFLGGLFFGWLALLFALFLPVISPDETVRREEPKSEQAEGAKEVVEVALPKKPWFYLDKEHKQVGPVPQKTLQELMEKGELSQKSYVWQEGMAEWKRLEEMREICVL